MPMVKYKSIFIDLDDTIWDFKANSVLSLRQVYDEFALKKEIPDYDRFKSLYMATNHELWELYHHNRITKDYLIVERFSRPLRHAGSKMSDKLRHRGPDWSGIYTGEKAILAHERLSIVDPQSGGQPLKSKDGKIILTVNGEIYNHLAIREQLKGEYEFQTE